MEDTEQLKCLLRIENILIRILDMQGGCERTETHRKACCHICESKEARRVEVRED